MCIRDNPIRDSARALLQCYREIAAVVRDEGVTTPAAEWFVDNFHIVDAVVRQVREDLPRGFYRQLPKLAEDPLRGYPRVLGLAWGFVAHTDSRFEPETLQRFVRRFQRVQPLTIGEPAQVLHEHDPERDGDGPELADG